MGQLSVWELHHGYRVWCGVGETTKEVVREMKARAHDEDVKIVAWASEDLPESDEEDVNVEVIAVVSEDG